MANYPVEPGDYYIIPYTKTTHCIDIVETKMTDGNNVIIYERSTGTSGGSDDGQAFNVSYRDDDTMQIVSRIVGKSLDFPGGTIDPSGMNVEIWTDNDTRAQQWVAEQKNTTVTINEVSYPTYLIKTYENQSYAMTYNTSNDNLEVKNLSSASESYFLWVFMPIPVFRSGGLYNIAPVDSTSMRVDVAGGETTNGANVQLWSSNISNAQKFVLQDTGAGWYIRNVASGKLMDVSGEEFVNGTNVQSWEQTEGGRAQLWDILTYQETVSIEGKACPIVRFLVYQSPTYCLDVNLSGEYKAETNITIWTVHPGRNQLFALIPTEATDPFMPSPYNLGFAETIGGPIKDTLYVQIDSHQSGNRKYYPAWYSVDSWANGGGNSFNIRYRKGTMSMINSLWSVWGDYSTWETAKVTRSGQRYDITNGIDVSFAQNDNVKAIRYEMQVRSAGPSETGLQLLTGPAVSKNIVIYREATITLGNPQLTKEGLTFPYSTNYQNGTSVINVISAIGSDDVVYLDRPYRKTQQSSETSFTIPWDKLKSIPASGALITVQLTVGTDLYESSMKTYTFGPLSVSYAAYTQASVTYEEGLAKTITAKISASLSDPHVFIIANGEMFECDLIPETETLANHGYMIPYPFGTTYDVYITGYIDNVWYFRHDVKQSDTPPVHAWNYNGVGCILQCRNDQYLETDNQIDSVYDEQYLVDRDWSYIQFARVKHGQFVANGAVIDGVTESSYKAFEQLVGKHVLYRSVSGDICYVAVTNINRRTSYLYTAIDVTMKRETI